ncbi:CG43183 [Drosophila busckii]|uniref:CG43183 n=1 Tax=Drosophila busckii TaxID=30019 RepID=A0A0M4EDV1_DROBS|nr:uncharacterized protein LOC108597669 [Drosophila busckii]ALC42140.1 CG43183 [Drosophila busckii]
MIYLQYCCFCVDLRIGTYIVCALDLLIDLIFGIIIAIFGENGIPDLGHKLFLVFMFVHLICSVMLLLGTIWLRPRLMLPYIITTLVKIFAMIVLIVSDLILKIWIVVIILYVVMFVVSIYFWLVVYSFYAALGGHLFI